MLGKKQPVWETDWLLFIVCMKSGSLSKLFNRCCIYQWLSESSATEGMFYGLWIGAVIIWSVVFFGHIYYHRNDCLRHLRFHIQFFVRGRRLRASLIVFSMKKSSMFLEKSSIFISALLSSNHESFIWKKFGIPLPISNNRFCWKTYCSIKDVKKMQLLKCVYCQRENKMTKLNLKARWPNIKTFAW